MQLFVSLKKDKIMESLRIDIVNPKAKSLLKNLADLNLIRIKKEYIKSEFLKLIDKMRNNPEDAPSMEDITAEVEAVRDKRYEE